MIDTATLIAFSIAALFLLIIPGPGIMYLLVRSISQGRKAGFISSLGLSAGTLVHVLATTLGLSAVLLTSAVAFNVVKSLGALYLVYLGIQAILDRKPLQLTKPVKAVSLSQLFTDGFIVSVFNPKIAMFFIAFLPQFVAPTAGNTTLQMLNLGLIFVALATLVDFLFAGVAGTFHRYLTNSVTKSAIPRYLTGSIYIGLGIGTALYDRPAD